MATDIETSALPSPALSFRLPGGAEGRASTAASSDIQTKIEKLRELASEFLQCRSKVATHLAPTTGSDGGDLEQLRDAMPLVATDSNVSADSLEWCPLDVLIGGFVHASVKAHECQSLSTETRQERLKSLNIAVDAAVTDVYGPLMGLREFDSAMQASGSERVLREDAEVRRELRDVIDREILRCASEISCEQDMWQRFAEVWAKSIRGVGTVHPDALPLVATTYADKPNPPSLQELLAFLQTLPGQGDTANTQSGAGESSVASSNE